jgi:cellulase
MLARLLPLLAAATTVSAHARIYGVWVNGEDQGDGRDTYIRSPPNNNPVKDLSLPDIVCNVNGGSPAASFVSAAAGDTVSFEWYHDNRNDDIIAASHQGPIITYIAEYTESDGTGPIWSKIAEDGYDGTQWAVDKLIANGGLNDVVLPANLAAGQYLIRQEIIAHHESETTFDQNPARGAQFYPSCIQFEITGSGSAVPDQGFDFNADYTYADPGINFNLYSSYTSYSIPGPEVWSAEGGSSPDPEEPVPSATTPASSAVSPAPTAPVSSATSVVAPAPTSTLSTVVVPGNSSSSAVPSVVPTPTSVVPAPSATPTTSPTEPCSRRRKRSSKKNKTKRSSK